MVLLGSVLVKMDEPDAPNMKASTGDRNQVQQMVLEFFVKLLCIPDTMLLDLLTDPANKAC